MSTQRATCWSVTINNPTEKEDEEISLARQKGWQVFGQKEKGANGTVHYQLMVKTPQVRFSAVKKAFSRAHIEIAHNPVALATYVHKSDTRLSPLSTSQDLYPSLTKFWELITMFITKLDCIDLDIDEDNLVHTFVDDDGNIHDEIYISKNPLALFDRAVEYLIRRGYNVESMSVNPQVRSSWKLYYQSILYRQLVLDKKAAHDKECPLQTDRQTDSAENIVEIALPVIQNANDKEEVGSQDSDDQT